MLIVFSQQYHAALILLHEPFAVHGVKQPQGSRPTALESCLENGISIARIFMHSRRRFDVRRSFINAMQHAGLAASALITSLAFLKNPQKRSSAMRHLLFMSTILQELAQTYRPAMRMHKVVDTVLKQAELGAGYIGLEQDFRYDEDRGQHIPVRRDSSSIEERTAPQTTSKRRMVEQFQFAEGDRRGLGDVVSDTLHSDSLDDSVDALLQNVSVQGALYNRAASSETCHDKLGVDQGSRPSAMGAQEQQWSQYPLTEPFHPSLADWEQLSSFPENMEMPDMASPFKFMSRY